MQRCQVLQRSILIVIHSLISRPLRLDIAGGLYHVTSHGDRPENIYHDHADRKSLERSATILVGERLILRLMPEQLHLFDATGRACERPIVLLS